MFAFNIVKCDNCYILFVSMKTIFSFFLVLLTMAISAKAQCLVLDIKLNDCPSCRNNLSIMKGLTDKFPIYATFQERLRADSADLDYKLSLSDYGVQYIFDDTLYKQFHNSESTSYWYFLDKNAKVVRSGDLKQFDSALATIVKTVDAIPPCAHCQFDFTEERVYSLDMDLDKITVRTKSDFKVIHSLRSRDFDFSSIARKLTGSDSTLFAKVGIMFNTKGNGFKPSYTWFDISEGNQLYVMMQYLHPIMRDSLSVEIRQCIVLFDDDGQQKDVFFINRDSVNKYDNYTGRFVLHDENKFVTFTHAINNWFDELLAEDPTGKIEFINSFELAKGKRYYSPYKQYNVDLPTVYKQKYFENYLSPELCSYPYISFRYANTLHNLKSLKNTAIIDSVLYKQSVDVGSKELGKEQFSVLAVSSVGDVVFVVYKLGVNTYIQSYNEQLNFKRKVNLGDVIKGRATDDCFIDPFSKQIYFTFNGDVNTVILPMSLYGF